ncbi:hypothetical protein NIE79_000824 [Micromonospora sp. NIE79]|uniref:Uncharacterized protein n=1 Tax=Micromonospora trifolii TaxID=2911208 RepID=A0ABS9MZA5_9ACTN|nr:hypothetical protein [Micromonospora trifolii]MCG5443034.1 hypothetical protein [Micromonospora trifolii]
MGIAWRESPEELVGLLRLHGLTPDRVNNVKSAWKAFRQFLAQPVDGLEPGPDSDADGFILQWGRYSWHDRLPSLSFTRQFAADARGTWTETDWYQPEIWQVSLEVVFPDAPALADLDRLNVQDTGIDFSPPGPERDRAIGEAEWEMQRYPTLRALWANTPAHSAVTLNRAD